MKKRLLGIDYGTKKVGLALSDESGAMAFPYDTIPNDGKLIDRIISLIDEQQVAALVIGESKDLKGADNPVMQDITNFAKTIKERAGTTVYFEPEWYTSVQARRNTVPEKADAAAAALILQSYIDNPDSNRGRAR